MCLVQGISQLTVTFFDMTARLITALAAAAAQIISAVLMTA